MQGFPWDEGLEVESKMGKSGSGPANVKGEPVLVSSSITCPILPHTLAMGLLAIFEHIKGAPSQRPWC